MDDIAGCLVDKEARLERVPRLRGNWLGASFELRQRGRIDDELFVPAAAIRQRGRLAGASDEDRAHVADMVDAVEEFGENLFAGERHDPVHQLLVEFGIGGRGEEEEAVAGREVDAGEIGWLLFGAAHGLGAIADGADGANGAGVHVIGDCRAGLRDNGLGAAPCEATHADAGAMFGDALPVPIAQIAGGFGEEALERTGQRKVVSAPCRTEGREEVAGMRFACDSRSLCDNPEFGTVICRTSATEMASVGAHIDGFVIDDRELADLEWFCHTRSLLPFLAARFSPLSALRTGGTGHYNTGPRALGKPSCHHNVWNIARIRGIPDTSVTHLRRNPRRIRLPWSTRKPP